MIRDRLKFALLQKSIGDSRWYCTRGVTPEIWWSSWNSSWLHPWGKAEPIMAWRSQSWKTAQLRARPWPQDSQVHSRLCIFAPWGTPRPHKIKMTPSRQQGFPTLHKWKNINASCICALDAEASTQTDNTIHYIRTLDFQKMGKIRKMKWGHMGMFMYNLELDIKNISRLSVCSASHI